MILTISLVVLLVSFLALMFMIWRQLVILRQGDLLTQRLASDEMLERWQARVDNYYFGFGLFFKSIAHYSYFYFLVVFKSIVSVFRYLLVSIEKQCIKMIDSLHHKPE